MQFTCISGIPDLDLLYSAVSLGSVTCDVRVWFGRLSSVCHCHCPGIPASPSPLLKQAPDGVEWFRMHVERRAGLYGDVPYLPFRHSPHSSDPHPPSFPIPTYLVYMAAISEPSMFQSLFQSALEEYEKQTGINLVEHSLALQLEHCNSVESITKLLHGQACTFLQF
jgi:hypothetical protein